MLGLEIYDKKTQFHFFCSKVFLKASKMIFDQKKEGFLLSYFTTDEKIFVVLNTAVFQLSYREILIFLNIPRKDLTDSL